MTEFVSSHPDGPGSPEDLLSKSVDDLLDDPILPRIVTDAMHFERRINAEGLDVHDRTQIISYLDGQWPYMQQPITISGRVFTHGGDRGGLNDKQYNALEATSHGFDVLNDAIIVDGESVAEYYRVCYFVFIENEDGTRVRALAPIDESSIVQLPFASRDLRMQRAEYLYPDEVAEIDNRLIQNDRDDEAFMSLATYRIGVNFDSASDIEKCEDLSEHMRAQVNFDRAVPYFASVQGPLMVLDGSGKAVPHIYKEAISGLISMHDILLRPEDVSLPSEGALICSPFIVVTWHNADKDGPSHNLMIPCSSIKSISSVRYLSPPDKTE